MGFLIAMFFTTFAHAGFEGYNSTTSLKIFNKVRCSSGVKCSRTKGGVFDISVLNDVVTATTTSLDLGQCGSTIVSDSADVISLPEASTALGCRYTFVCGTVDNFGVNPADGTDQIGPVNYIAAGTSAALAPAAGDAIQCTDIGSSIMLEAVGVNLWVAVGTGNGLWADIN